LHSPDGIVRSVWAELEPHLAQAGYELIEVQIGHVGQDVLLRLFIDKEGGVTLDDCTKATRLVNPVLDLADLIKEHYMLEVSSPGIERPLRKEEHFRRFMGEQAKIKTHTPVEGKKRFAGTLKGVDDGMVVIECEGAAYSLHLENIDKAHLTPDYADER
jgi:ribosome maturation factor RimP